MTGKDGIDVKEYEKALNDILPGLTMYVRDVNLPQDIARKYTPGLIIRDPGFVDASSRVGGMVTSHRFAILSNHMADLSRLEHGTNWGLTTSRFDSHFKVLDVHEFHGRTQILLLHLPDDNRWRMFDGVRFSLEDQLIADSRGRFERKSVMGPIPELTTGEWLARCEHPLGINDEGDFFGLNPAIARAKRPVKNAGFRMFYHRFVYLACRDALATAAKTAIPDDVDGAIAYGYVDANNGMAFGIARLASIENNHIHMSDLPAEAPRSLLRKDVEDADYIDLSITDLDLKPLADYEKAMRAAHDTRSRDTETLRDLTILDSGRNPWFPDAIDTLLLHGDDNPVEVWVHVNELSNDTIYGVLLTKPAADFGVHQGDRVPVMPYQTKSGDIVFISPLDAA